MDLKIIGEPTDAERAAVDAVLGDVPPPRALPARRDLLLPALHALQARAGWISKGGLAHVCRRLGLPPAEAYGVASFYHLFAFEPPASDTVVRACDDVACRLAGGPAGHATPCLGMCEHAPATLVTVSGPAARAYLTPEDPPPKIGRRGRLLERVGTGVAHSPAGLSKAKELGPAKTIEAIATLVGRGGAAFPTGQKWAAVAREPARPKYVVCNADESETGTFKDRILLEHDALAVIEGLAIAAFAAGCERGFVYVRGEYPLAAARVSAAIEEAKRAGWLELDVEVRRGAGAYICGEETALFNSIEGKRGEPRAKPPFPTQSGLFGKPTVVNNVETLACARLLLAEGGPPPRLFCVSGRIAKPGLYELETPRTLGELLEMAGGVADGRALQAILLGGAAGTFVGPDMIDLPLTNEGARARGASLGSGVVLVVDDQADLRDLLARVAAFFRDESCGQCVPCRVGTARQAEALERLRRGDPEAPALLADLGAVMKDASICGLGQTAASAIESGLRLVRS
jgi:NADH-quinone oxidoreductase subunit F